MVVVAGSAGHVDENDDGDGSDDGDLNEMKGDLLSLFILSILFQFSQERESRGAEKPLCIEKCVSLCHFFPN
ncbi:unnamed protein product [Angiostrongylus costaricensis]|uniref:Uncharacterized protein n=1 Tax=Angiostrongylus costaricensis TaxID=334426 RepID=A0A0R3PKV6_ANGCS|nr:unnamed protein product [Angiostrongylus costaricensis]